MTTGAEVVVSGLLEAGVDVCFANPGTSEMHFVAALDTTPGMRAVLCLFEGVATGAADGYARITGRPAATLLHLGPGMANGLANLHNARRAHSPLVNIVGDHATHHQKLDAPLQSDIEALAGWVHGSLHRPTSTADLGQTVADAVAASKASPGRVATVVLPADLSWDTAPEADVAAVSASGSDAPGDCDASCAADLLKAHGANVVVLLGGPATTASSLRSAAAIASATGARVLIETFPARLTRGRGVPNFERLGYLAEQAEQQLSGATHLILVGARAPVTFFAYPGKASDLVPDGAEVHTLSGAAESTLANIATRLDAPEWSQPAVDAPILPKGALTAANWAEVIGALLPENAIISDEANTSGVALPAATSGSPPHDVLTLTGGAIGQGLPVAVGAAIAAPDRPVIAVQADGSALYTISALWTMAREQLDVTVVILNNHAYAILQLELLRVGATAGGERSRSLLDLSRPDIDFVAIAEGFGVPATRAATAEDLAAQFAHAVDSPGPHLIDAAVPGWSVG